MAGELLASDVTHTPITALLAKLSRGGHRRVRLCLYEDFLPAVVNCMRFERAIGALHPTEPIHEACVRLVQHPWIRLHSRTHLSATVLQRMKAMSLNRELFGQT